MRLTRTRKIILMLLPCPTIIAGFYWLHSVWIAMAAYHVIIIFSLIMAQESGFPKKILAGRNYKQALYYSLLTACSGIFIYILWPLMKNETVQLGKILSGYGLYEQQWLLFILYYSLITPLLEEYFWRELLGSIKKVPDLSDFLYAFYHVPVLLIFIKPVYILLILLILTCTACLWRNIKNHQKGLFVPFVSHFFADVSTIFAIYLLHKVMNVVQQPVAK